MRLGLAQCWHLTATNHASKVRDSSDSACPDSLEFDNFRTAKNLDTDGTGDALKTLAFHVHDLVREKFAAC